MGGAGCLVVNLLLRFAIITLTTIMAQGIQHLILGELKTRLQAQADGKISHWMQPPIPLLISIRWNGITASLMLKLHPRPLLLVLLSRRLPPPATPSRWRHPLHSRYESRLLHLESPPSLVHLSGSSSQHPFGSSLCKGNKVRTHHLDFFCFDIFGLWYVILSLWYTGM